MTKDEWRHEVLKELRRIGDLLQSQKPGKVQPRVVTPPPDTIPPTNPNNPPGIPGPIEPPPIDRMS